MLKKKRGDGASFVAMKKVKQNRNYFLFKEISLKVKIFSVLAVLLLSFIVLVLGYYNFVITVCVFFSIFLVLIYGFLIFLEYRKHRLVFMNQLLSSFEIRSNYSFYRFPLPVLACSKSGTILWYNENFYKTWGVTFDLIGVKFSNFVKVPLQDFCVPNGLVTEHYGKHFRIYGNYFEKSNIFILLFEDITDFIVLQREHLADKVCVLYVVIDNYREILTNKKDSEKSAIVGIVDNLIESFVDEHDGILQKYREDEFFIVLKQKSLNEIVSNKFNILQVVKNSIVNEKQCELTISIGVGSGAESFADCKKFAFQALDMALGRGGDQAAVKTPGAIKFYGGNSKELYKSSRVKARVVARALLELVKNSSNVLIMGHKFGDLDCCGAAVGLALVIRKLQKNSIIAIDRHKNLSKILFEKVEEAGYNDIVVDLDLAKNFVDSKTLLIVLDTHNLNLLDSKELYEQCSNVVVIDHHRKAVDCIKNAVIFYHEPYASSTCELVCELIQQFGYEKLIGAFEAQALLSGIMLDTKNFAIKVGVRTFEAAAYLKRMGADTVEVKKMFSSSLVSYHKKTKIVMGSEIYRNCAIAISEFSTSDMRIIAPQAADELLSIAGVDASFVLFELNGKVFITARSLGKFNVQVIMENLKGGGHQMQAACQLEGIGIRAARAMLVKAIDDWLS